MRHPRVGLAIVTVALLLLSGCVWYKGKAIRPQIVPQREQDTPAQSVPPATGHTQTQPPPGSLGEGTEQQAAATHRSSGYAGLTGLDWSGTVQRFEAAYKLRKSPRIAILLNRALSDEIRDWKLDEGYVVQYGEKGGKQAQLEVYPAKGVEEEPRPAPGETWMWAFEDGFLSPFTEADVKLVDRATIMRLAAAKTQGKEGTLTPLAVKRVEMDALSGYADVFVELLISASPRAQYGYEFKATAKDVKTGAVLANVTSVNWKTRPESETDRKVLVGQSDYQVVVEKKLPTLDEVASTLALETMSALAKGWE